MDNPLSTTYCQDSPAESPSIIDNAPSSSFSSPLSSPLPLSLSTTYCQASLVEPPSPPASSSFAEALGCKLPIPASLIPAHGQDHGDGNDDDDEGDGDNNPTKVLDQAADNY